MNMINKFMQEIAEVQPISGDVDPFKAAKEFEVMTSWHNKFLRFGKMAITSNRNIQTLSDGEEHWVLVPSIEDGIMMFTILRGGWTWHFLDGVPVFKGSKKPLPYTDVQHLRLQLVSKAYKG